MAYLFQHYVVVTDPILLFFNAFQPSNHSVYINSLNSVPFSVLMATNINRLQFQSVKGRELSHAIGDSGKTKNQCFTIHENNYNNI